MTQRVWDPFLTEQDKLHLAQTRPKAPYGFGRRAAVLSVDNYRAAIGDEPLPLLESIKQWPNSAGLAGWRALESIAVLLQRARAAGLPVIHLTGLAEEDSGIPGWSSRRGSRGAAVADPAARDRHRRRYDIVEQAAPLPGEVVLTKTAPSAFFGTPLAAHLIRESIDTLIVCGEAVSGCVRATVVDGCSYRLNMIVVEECVYDRHEATRAMNLFDIDQKYGDVIGLADALAHIDSLGSTSQPAGHQHGEHAHHSRVAADRPNVPAATVRLPAAVLRALPPGAVPHEVCQHPIHGHVLARAGDEVLDAARQAMVAGFDSSEHAVVAMTAADVDPGDDPRIGEALASTAGGVLLVGVGWTPAAPAPAPAAADPSPGAAAVECPECGASRPDVVAPGPSGAVLLGCPECGTVWDAG